MNCDPTQRLTTPFLQNDAKFAFGGAEVSEKEYFILYVSHVFVMFLDPDLLKIIDAGDTK